MLEDPTLTTILTNLVAVGGIVTATVVTLYKLRKLYRKRLDDIRAELKGKWSNEGVAIGPQPAPIEIEIRDADGALIGSAFNWTEDSPTHYQLSVEPGLFRSKVLVTQLWGRQISAHGTAYIRVTENPRRLHWKFTRSSGCDLPRKSITWPY